jgi:hypothetical protein
MPIAVIVNSDNNPQNKHHIMNTDDELVLALLVYVYMLKYIQLKGCGTYVPLSEYKLFEFSLNA